MIGFCKKYLQYSEFSELLKTVKNIFFDPDRSPYILKFLMEQFLVKQRINLTRTMSAESVATRPKFEGNVGLCHKNGKNT